MPRQHTVSWSAAFVGVLLATSPARAATVTGSVQLAVIAGVTLTKNTDLEFGTLFASPTAGTVVINPTSGARTRTGGVSFSNTIFTPARFTATGDANARVQITIPNTPIFINRLGGGAQMRVRRFRRQALPPPQPRIGAAGTLSFNVGATLDVGANQLPGRYTGTFNVTVDYQ